MKFERRIEINDNQLKVELVDVDEDWLEKDFIFKCSGRVLELNFNKQQKAFRAYMFDEENAPEVKDRTTALLQIAQQIMHEEARLINQVLTFVYDTTIFSMREWALTKGEEIFNWETVQDEIGEPFIAITKISP